MDNYYTDKREVIKIRSSEDQKFLNNLGESIRQLRVKRNWTQERLAFKSNLDRTYIGGIERGERNPTALNLKRISDALGVPIGEILYEYSE